MDFGERRVLYLLVFHDTFRRLHIRLIAAFRTNGERILSDFGKQHEFMGHAAAHHAGIRFDCDDVLRADTAENALIRLVTALIIGLKILLRRVERIGVLHGKFTNTDQSPARARFVAEFRLNLINHERKIRIGFRRIARKMDSRLLVRHTEHHIVAAPVLKARHLAADARIPAGLLPQRRRHHHGKQHLLAVDAVHLLTDDFFDFGRDTLRRRKQRVNPVSHIFHIAAAHHQRVACNHTVLRRFLEAFSEHFGNFH